MVQHPQSFMGKGVTPNEIDVSVEKNSFGDVGEVKMFYKPEFSLFEDSTDFNDFSNVILPDNKIAFDDFFKGV